MSIFTEGKPTPPRIYGGVRADLWLAGQGMTEPVWMTVLYLLIDLPLSAALDTALLPISIPCELHEIKKESPPQLLTAEETFLRIEEQIRKTKAIRVRFTSGPPHHPEMTGELLLKKDNKARLVFRRIAEEKQTLVSSNNVKISRDFGGIDASDPEASGKLKRLLEEALARSGIGILVTPSLPVRIDANETFEVTDLQSGEDEAETKIITYKLRIRTKESEHILYTVKLWYMPKTFELRWRTLTWKTPDSEETRTEIYQEFTFDVDIRDEEFKLPEEK